MSLYAAAELSGVDHSGAATEITATNLRDGTYGIRAAIYIGRAVGDFISTGTGLGAFTTFWHRFTVYPASSAGWGTTRSLVQYLNNAGTPVFRIQQTATSAQVQGQYWNGSAWVNVGGTYTFGFSALKVLDIKLVCGASGSFEVYENDILIMSGSGDFSAVTDVDEWRLYSMTSSSSQWAHSEFIWGDESTVGHRYCLAPPTGDGADTAGSGTFAEVDEALTNDSDVSTLAANGDAETYTHAAMTLPDGVVKSVQVEQRVNRAASGAQNIKARLRVGGTAYDQAANYTGIATAFSAYRASWFVNPAGGNWTPTTAAQTSNQFGAVAQT